MSAKWIQMIVCCPKLDCYISTFLLKFVYLPFLWNKNASVFISHQIHQRMLTILSQITACIQCRTFSLGFFLCEIVLGVTHREVIQSQGFHHCIPSCPSSTPLCPSLSHCLLVLCAVVVLLGNEEKQTGHTPPCSQVHPCILLSCLLGRESSP